MNREDGFCLSKAWKSVVCCLNEHKKPAAKDTLWLGFSDLVLPVETALFRVSVTFYTLLSALLFPTSVYF
jgi:hypothetical protein